MTAPNFAAVAAAATVVPVLGSTSATAGQLTANLASGDIVVGFVDPVSSDRIFNPVAEGNPVASGDAASTWLPTVKALVAAQVTDEYWAPVADQIGTTVSSYPQSVGQVKLELTPATKNTVEAASVMTFYLSPQALVLVYPSSATAVF